MSVCGVCSFGLGVIASTTQSMISKSCISSSNSFRMICWILTVSPLLGTFPHILVGTSTKDVITFTALLGPGGVEGVEYINRVNRFERSKRLG